MKNNVSVVSSPCVQSKPSLNQHTLILNVQFHNVYIHRELFGYMKSRFLTAKQKTEREETLHLHAVLTKNLSPTTNKDARQALPNHSSLVSMTLFTIGNLQITAFPPLMNNGAGFAHSLRIQRTAAVHRDTSIYKHAPTV